jgi:hypothetical protein
MTDAVMQMVSVGLYINTPTPSSAIKTPAPSSGCRLQRRPHNRAYCCPRRKDAYNVDFKSPVPITRQEPKQILMSIAQLLLLGDLLNA